MAFRTIGLSGSLRICSCAALLLALCPPALAADVVVRDSQGVWAAVRRARPGTRVLLAPGDYAGGIYLENIHGTKENPIVIGAVDPEHPPRIVGGAAGIQLSDPAYLELRDLVLTGATGNGLSVDDGGTYDTPAHDVFLRRLTISDVGPRGNRDGIKLSGVDDFRVEQCVIRNWGDGGQGIDMVGCHKGVIEGCAFDQTERSGGEGVQAKGGSSDVTVRRCRFEHIPSRAVNAGGSTGLQFFRPRAQGCEAKRIVVEGSTFFDCQSAVAFVGVDGATVRFNTIYRPGKWAIRILQETTAPGFVPCRNGVFEDNIILFRSDHWFEGGVNVGPNTAPDTFRFARNVWYCEDRPDRSAPALPTPETDGVVGKDPLLRDPLAGDFRLKEGSPAAGKGATAAAT